MFTSGKEYVHTYTTQHTHTQHNTHTQHRHAHWWWIPSLKEFSYMLEAITEGIIMRLKGRVEVLDFQSGNKKMSKF